MSSESRRTVIHDQPIEYNVRESVEATRVRIDVGIHAVTVVVPEGTNLDPEELLQENAEWVLDKRAKFQEYKAKAPDRVFVEGETFPYRGEPHEVMVESRSASDVVDGTIRLAAHHVEQTSLKQALERLYRRKAREHIEAAAKQYARKMGVEYHKLEIRNQRTKWGSCSSSGTLGINWRLVLAPPEILEYVVVHELAHLREGNHNQSFWSLVADHDPDYQNHVSWLENNSTKLIFTPDDL